MNNTLTISTIQTNLFWEDKQANLNMLEQKILGISNKTEIVVLPEMFSTGFSMQPSLLAEKMDGNTIQWMQKIAATQKIILTGSIIIEEDNNYYNRLIWMLPNGQMGYYNKRHCFAFAQEDKFYTAGNKRLITSVNGWKINVQICYDLRFPVWARQQSLHAENNKQTTAEYDVLLYVANWPERRNFAWQNLLTTRAIENQSYVVAVNRVGNDGNNIYHCGNSMVVNALGETLYAKAHDEDINTIVLQKNHLEEVRSKFPFLNDADDFKIATLH